MIPIRLFYAFLLCFLSSYAFAGTPHYINCEGSGSDSGTYANPFLSIASANSHAWNEGDDLYFAVNTQCDAPAAGFNFTWDGNSGDRAIIGAYYGDGQFGLNGNSRPIIDGNETAPTGDYDGLVVQRNESYNYITIENLNVRNSKWEGITTYGDKVIIKNNIVYNTGSQGIMLVRCNTGEVKYNDVSYHSRSKARAGAAIEITTGNQTLNACKDVVVQYNTVHDSNSHEGIGFYKRCSDGIAEYNHVYNITTYALYAGNAQDIIFRYNLVFSVIAWAFVFLLREFINATRSDRPVFINVSTDPIDSVESFS